MTAENKKIQATDALPEVPAKKLMGYKPDLLLSEDHHLCPGCGEPPAVRMMLEAIQELGCAQKSIGVIGIGCSWCFFRRGLGLKEFMCDILLDM